MIESAIVVSIVSLLCGTLMAPMQWVLNAAGLFLACGFALGVPTGFWYHVALGRALRPRDQLPAHWWLKPTELHPLLLPDERFGVLSWFRAGAIGFLFTAFGCMILAGAALRLVVETPS